MQQPQQHPLLEVELLLASAIQDLNTELVLREFGRVLEAGSWPVCEVRILGFTPGKSSMRVSTKVR